MIDRKRNNWNVNINIEINCYIVKLKSRTTKYLYKYRHVLKVHFDSKYSTMGNIKISDIVAKNGGITLVKVQAITDKKYGL